MDHTALRVTAHLASSVCVMDDWSPSLDALLEWAWFDERGISVSPTSETVQTADLPVARGGDPDRYPGGWWWCVSSPHYTQALQQTDWATKRWEADLIYPVDWGRRKATIQTACGPEKSYRLPIFLRSSERIDWWLLGEPTAIKRLLERVTGLGRRRNIGYGQILSWQVCLANNDWHLVGPEGQLMRPIPVGAASLNAEWNNQPRMLWAPHPPGWMPQNWTLCLMPTGNIVRLETAEGVSGGRS
ncbi:hypothetical protein [Gloeobacter morelensis]|uniref:hypothetical protein n=1 Tax=Gloeobacter morelensis TaxID=2907343 RepID=UPI001E5CCB50|nr:hypothetical protein [Gloeobacter morelensis]UFP97187.1 hypothetical protein ISF26_24000 [Gloeobacter morelensis MG652769]